MITIRLKGGLGNQMFQYATARALAYCNGVQLILDVGEFDTYDLRDLEIDKYKIKAEVKNQGYLLKKVIRKLKLDKFLNSYFFEKNLKYDNTINNLGVNLYLEGYFQSEKYFYNIREELLKEFTLKSKKSLYTKQMEGEILNEKVAISLHVRRGDYISDESTASVHGGCDLEYYQRAMDFMGNKFEGIKYFIFSDDMTWVKDNFKKENITYVDSKEERAPHEDVCLMSLCDHHIIANSSFSWWGAWLNKNKSKVVVAPERWFRDKEMYEQSMDIVCENWVKV